MEGRSEGRSRENSGRHPDSPLEKGVPGVLGTGQEGEGLRAVRGEGHVTADRPEVGSKDRWTVCGESAGGRGHELESLGDWSLPPLSSAGLLGLRGPRAVMWRDVDF